MKFVCSHCKAKYQLADEKVAGRTLRMTCRTCGQEILIRAEPTPHSPSPHSPSPIATPTPIGIPAPIGARSSLPEGRVPPPPAAAFAPRASLIGAPRASLVGAPRALQPPPPSPLGADFRAAVAPPAPSAAQSAGPPDEWHVAIDDHPVGPIRRDEVARKIAAGALGPDSLAWREGLDDWMPIHDIPELLVLCNQSGGVPAVAAVAAAAPSTIGGRAGAAPGFAVEDWAQLAPPRSAPPAATLSEAEIGALRGPRMPSMPVMFAIMGGFAFLMSVVAILGARYLAKDATARSTETAQAAATTAPPSAQPTAPATPKENVIELDEQVFDDGAQSAKPRSGGARPSATSQKPKRELTDAEKAMLARMGGQGSDLSGLSRQSADSTGPARAGGSLTASELSAVVNRNKKQLQRCYETALRGAGSDDTVRLDVSLNIAPSGGVSSVQVAGNGLPGMSECIERSVRSWRFPSAGESSATRFPLLFQPGS